MPIAEADHLTTDEIDAFLAGRLTGDRLSRVEDHVSSCDECCRAMTDRPEDKISRRLRAHLRPTGVSNPAAAAPAGEDVLPADLRDHPRYRVVRQIGVGGMGRVYLAEHRLMERNVALKVIDRRVMGHPTAAARFGVEVKAAAKLDHPNIVRAFDAEQAGSTHFLVMEYVEGVSLARLIRERGPLDLQQACGCIRQAALGLQHAADRGMVHRDIKPENLMLTRRGTVKILDFGLARLARETGVVSTTDESATSRTESTLTTVGSVFGTPAYIAPEQARDSGDVDIRADIYSLGCTLHYLLTGKTPSPAERSHAGGAQRSVTLDAPSLPSAIVPVLERMTAADPADRYQTPSAVVEALAPFCRKGKSAKRSNSRKIIAMSVAAAVALAAGGFGIRAMLDGGSTPGQSTTPAVGVAPLAAGVPLATPPRVSGRPAVLVLLPPRFYREDYSRVRTLLERAGVRVVVASVGPCVVDGGTDAGRNVEPDIRLDRSPPDARDFDALYFPGGYISPFKDEGPTRKLVWELIDRMQSANKPIAALGHGQGVLAVKGALSNRTVAINQQLRGWMPGYAGRAAPGNVATDGPFITASESADADALAGVLAKVLKPSQ